jgi:hypothetical protein
MCRQESSRNANNLSLIMMFNENFLSHTHLHIGKIEIFDSKLEPKDDCSGGFGISRHIYYGSAFEFFLILKNTKEIQNILQKIQNGGIRF